MSSKIDINVNNIFFESYSIDPKSGHPIYVFDSTYLPSSDEVNDKRVYDILVDKLMDRLIAKLPSTPYSLVVFSSGFASKDISWVYGIKMYSKLPLSKKIYLKKVYIVHESFFIRTIYQIFKNAMMISFLNNKESKDVFIHVSNLSELSKHIDITRLRISLKVYLYDYQFSEFINISSEYYEERSKHDVRQYRQIIFDKIFKKLKLEAPANELVFQKPGSYKKTNILLDIIERNNYIDLSQWDIYSLAVVFLNFLKNKSKPLIPIDFIPLPISDDFHYTFNTFFSMMQYNNYYELVKVIFPLFIDILKNTSVTKHDLKSMSKCLTSTLCKEKLSIKSGDRLAVGTRYIKNVLIYFDDICDKIDKTRFEVFLDGSLGIQIPPEIPKPRKSSPTKYPKPLGNYGLPIPASVPSSHEQSPTTLIGKHADMNNHSLQNQSLPTITSPAILRQDNFDLIHNRTSSSLFNENDTSSILLLSDDQVQHMDNTLGKQIVTDSTLPSDDQILILEEDIKKLAITKIERVKTFDKELKLKKLKNKVILDSRNKFSMGYSDMKSGNKVNRLAALYEERLQGIKVMNEIKYEL